MYILSDVLLFFVTAFVVAVVDFVVDRLAAGEAVDRRGDDAHFLQPIDGWLPRIKSVDVPIVAFVD